MESSSHSDADNPHATAVCLDDDAASRYAQAVGLRLRSVRRQKRLSLQAVERESGEEFKASVLGAYERGERAISVPRLRRLADLYAVPVDQLLPGDPSSPFRPAATPANDPSLSAQQTRKVTVDLLKLASASGPEGDVLRHFAASVQVQRQDFNGKVITIRGSDLQVIASVLGRSVDDLVRSMAELGLLKTPAASSRA